MRTEINIGEEVMCDFCNYGEESMGGVLIGSGTAVCGDCCDSKGYDKPDYKYSEDITEIFDKNKTFKENVLNLRERTTGQRAGIIVFSDGDDFFKAMGLK